MYDLPVDVEYVHREHWIREVPYDNVPRFAVDVPPIIIPELFILITGYVIKELQDNATRDKTHTLAHNLSVENNRENNYFLRLLKGTAEYVAVRLLRKEDDERVESIVRECAAISVAVATAKLINEYPILVPKKNTLAYEEYDSVLAKGEQIKDEVKTIMYNMNNNQQYPQQQPFYQEPPRFVKAIDGNGMPITERHTNIVLYTDGVNLIHPQQIGMPVEHFFPQQMHHQHPNPNHYPQHNQGSWSNSNRGPNIVRSMERHDIEEFGSNTNGEFRTNNTPVAGRGNLQTNSTTNQNTTAVNTVSSGKPRIGEETKNSPTLSWIGNANQPYPLCYNPFNETLHYCNAGKDIWIHETKQRTGENNLDYLLHELRPELRAKHKRDLENAKTRMAKQENPVSGLEDQNSLLDITSREANSISQLSPNELLMVKEAVYVEGDDNHMIVCTSIADGINKVEQKLRDKSVSTRNTITFGASVTEEIIVTSVDREMIEQIKVSENDFLTLSNILSSYQFRIDKPSRLWYRLTELLVKRVNEFIKYGLGSSISITNFSDDAQAIVGYIESKLGSVAGDLIRRFQDEIVMGIFNNIRIVEDGGLLTATLVEEVAVTVIPATAMELKVNFDKIGYGVITTTRFPTLYPILRNLLAGKQPLARTVLVTGDNVILEVRNGLLVPNSILLGLQ